MNNIEQIIQELKTCFETHTPGQIMKDMYGDIVERLKKFDANLWKEAVDIQLAVGDEELYYADESYQKKKFLPLFECWASIVDDKLPWQSVDESAFPIQFLIIENSGKRLVMSVMVGQGAVCDILPIDNFKAWMERCDNKYTFDETKFVTVDDMTKAFKETIEEYEDMFKE